MTDLENMPRVGGMAASSTVFVTLGTSDPSTCCRFICFPFFFLSAYEREEGWSCHPLITLPP